MSTDAALDITTERRPRAGIATALPLLEQRFGDRLQTGQEVCRQHGHTLTGIPNQPPDAVLFAQTTQDVADAMRIAKDYEIPVIAFGGGTSLEGHVNAPDGGLSIDLTGMDRVLSIHAEDMQCVVEAAVTRETLNEQLRDTGLYFPIDPGAETATLGGMAATRASGTTAVRYGTMRDNVVNMTVVLANGEIIKTGNRAPKSSAGYDLTHLMIGSEGTLGIITELTVNLHPRPETIVAAVAPFRDIEGACNATIEACQCGLELARIELLDSISMAAVNKHSKLTLDEVPTLFLEFHGSKSAVDEAVEVFRAIGDENNALRYDWADSREQQSSLWRARHEVFWALRSYWPGKSILVTDVCVPISRLAECVIQTQEDLAENNLTGPIVGHVGDGNFHVTVVHDRDDEAEMQRIKDWLDRLAKRAMAMEGTCTGEHGIGQGKRSYLQQEHGEAVSVMKAVKDALDPLGILNPGKIFQS